LFYRFALPQQKRIRDPRYTRKKSGKETSPVYQLSRARRLASAFGLILAVSGAGSLLSACASLDYNLPAVSSESDGQRRAGKFIWHDLISDDPAGSERFYRELFGWEFQSVSLVGADYWVISLAGEPIAGMVAQAGLRAQQDISQWISVLSVADIEAATAEVRRAGGHVWREPVSIGDRGVIAVFADKQGANFAALTTRGGDPVDSAELPPEGAFLWHELWTSDVDAAAGFYAGLAQLQGEARGGQSVQGLPIAYTLLRASGIPRAGVRTAPDPEMPPLWMPYLRVAEVSRLDALLDRVPQLGGSVLVPRVARPVGGYVAVIAGPSGAPIALQTWGSDQPLLEEM
jgi:predicted enzyme related to lactoylglutathione lyase